MPSQGKGTLSLLAVQPAKQEAVAVARLPYTTASQRHTYFVGHSGWGKSVCRKHKLAIVYDLCLQRAVRRSLFLVCLCVHPKRCFHLMACFASSCQPPASPCPRVSACVPEAFALSTSLFFFFFFDYLRVNESTLYLLYRSCYFFFFVCFFLLILSFSLK